MTLNDAQSRLTKLEFALDRAGGRGVELADEIDAHRAAMDILKGEDALCPNCLTDCLTIPEEQNAREALADELVNQSAMCSNCNPGEERYPG